jgi:hypothetical protein
MEPIAFWLKKPTSAEAQISGSPEPRGSRAYDAIREAAGCLLKSLLPGLQPVGVQAIGTSVHNASALLARP